MTGVLWRFSRPHTIVGTVLSILGLYAITVDDPGGQVPALVIGLLAGITVNVFIVGLNQIEDVDIDRVNKPHLPIAAGDLSLRTAWVVVVFCAAFPLLVGLTQGVAETVAVSVALLVGWAYSSPPLRLKRFPALAAGAISLVRAVVVNLGVALHFTSGIPAAVWALTLFVLPFSFAIAVLKDVPDIEGDRRFAIATFSVRLGPQRVMRIGMAALTVAYLGMATAGTTIGDPALMAGGHLGLLALLWWRARRVDVHDREDFTGFYMFVWALFFAEYILVPAAVLLG